MRPREFAKLLLVKAGQDEFTVEKLVSDEASPNEVIGFHAQQAVEKMLKAVLAHRSIPFRRTHDIVELIDLIRDRGITFPEHLESVRHLNPFAVEFRYDQLPEESAEPFDRVFVLACVQRTRAWVNEIIPKEETL